MTDMSEGDGGFQYNVLRTVLCRINNSWQIYKRLQKISWGRCAYDCQLMNSLSTCTAALPRCVIHKSQLILGSRLCISLQVLWGGLNCSNGDTKLISEHQIQDGTDSWTDKYVTLVALTCCWWENASTLSLGSDEYWTCCRLYSK